jgi:hypothetical protein
MNRGGLFVGRINKVFVNYISMDIGASTFEMGNVGRYTMAGIWKRNVLRKIHMSWTR